LIQARSAAPIFSVRRSDEEAFREMFGAIAPAESHFSASCWARQSSVVITV
jgi:hypothetical protein